ncbi:MAG: hypothetical protein JRG92_10680 [Deltaproteobacteria bacterium]|nr:hypothetical protein [Deltaproteobacteria bacterium]MBW2384093.1 hypothetical protein [Deltaproteobacteria bacterium]MBW2695372.1 hypothetical protein [Deltaproteobacteria bacterium]
MSNESLSDLGKTLTDSFYKGLDREAILAAIRQNKKTLSAREMVAAVWGISDDAVLGKLVDLGLTSDTVAAISLTPLVAVAWADGKLDKKERAAVLEAAREYGLEPGDVSYLLLEGRLAERPDPELMDTWRNYIRMMSKILDTESLCTLRGELIARARQVAEASGGILGLGSKISKSELALLDELEQAFS